MIKVGLIGCGKWGKNYIHTIKQIPEVKLVWVHNREYKSYLDEVDTIIIATPSKTHYQVAKDVLNNGKNVLVEKPFTNNSDQALELTNLAKEKSLILMVGHLLLHHTGIIKLKELIDSGYLGDIKEIFSKRLSMNNGVNAAWEMFPHDIYILNYFFNLNPLIIKSFGPIHYKYIIMKYNKIKVSVELCTLYPKKIRQFVIKGSKKICIFDDTKTDKLKVYTYDNKEENIILENNNPLKDQCQHFFNCVKNEIQPLSDGLAGYENVKIIENILK